MSLATVINAFAIPAEALVEQRVPKKLLVEQGSPTAADKRRIQDGIEEMLWLAALKPTNIGVPAYKDDVREYMEIAVLTVSLRAAAKPPRLIELIHRAIPYPLVLVSEHSGAVAISLAHKRWSQGEAGKVVIEDVRQIPLSPDTPTAEEASFLGSIAISALPSAHLFAVYDGLMARLTALEVANITGTYAPAPSTEQADARREGLDNHARLQHDLAILRTKAHKEKQLNRRVELNVEITRLEAELAATKKTL